MKINGGLYTLPSSFYVGTFMSDGDILDKMIGADENDLTWEQLEDISRRYMQKEGAKNGRYALANYAPEEFLRLVVKNNNAAYIDQDNRKANFDTLNSSIRWSELRGCMMKKLLLLTKLNQANRCS